MNDDHGMNLAQVRLESPPFVQSVLFENPWPLVIVLVLIAFVLLFVWRGRRGSKPLIISGALLVAALGVYVTAALVVTEREHLQERTRELVQRAGVGSTARVRDMFHGHGVLVGPDGSVWYNPVEAALVEFDSVKRRYTMMHTIRSVQAEHLGGNRGRTLLSVSSRVHEMDNQAVPSQWLFVWERGADGQWLVLEAHFLRLGALPPSKGMWR